MFTKAMQVARLTVLIANLLGNSKRLLIILSRYDVITLIGIANAHIRQRTGLTHAIAEGLGDSELLGKVHKCLRKVTSVLVDNPKIPEGASLSINIIALQIAGIGLGEMVVGPVQLSGVECKNPDIIVRSALTIDILHSCCDVEMFLMMVLGEVWLAEEIGCGSQT